MYNIDLYRTKDIVKYRDVLDGLADDFGPPFFHTMVVWCGLTTNTVHINKHWEVYLVKQLDKAIGVCGLYSLDATNENLWLGWFGIIPERRNSGVGRLVLDELLNKKCPAECKRIFSYVPKHGKPLPFYRRYGFEVVSNVAEFLESHPYDKQDFGDLDDYIICLTL